MTVARELLALFGAVFALCGSYAQGRQALLKATSELAHASAGVRGRTAQEPARSWLRDMSTAWKVRAQLPVDSSDPAERDARHFVTVAGLWLVILLGAVLAVLAAVLDVIA